MLFNSYEFVLLFLPLALGGYWLAAARFGAGPAITWLVLASLLFYAWWNPVYLPLLLASVLINYALGRQLARPLRWRRGLLVSGIALNLAALGYYKYTNFLLGAVDGVLATTLNPAPIILPLAISFFTFQQIAYLVDSYRGLTHEYSFSRYALFVTFFPQLIAGPIVHHKEMLPQFFSQGRLQPRAEDFAVGLTIFVVGLFKKVIMADGIAAHASPIFAAAEEGRPIEFFLAWTAGISYSLQLYFDFSGYSDMAVGLARLFGIRLPINFDSPYKSRSIAELWRRWHITLSRFFRDYLYFPLGGNRVSEARLYFNIFIVMFLSGLWHGAGWTFVVWGAYNGVLVVINHAWGRMRTALAIDGYSRWWDGFSAQVLTLMAWVVGFTMFRADSLSGAGNIIAGMFGLHGAALPQHWQPLLAPLQPLFTALHIEFVNATLMLTYAAIAWMLALTAIVLFTPNIYQLLEQHRPAIAESGLRPTRWPHWRAGVPAALAVSVLALFALLDMSSVSEFLYFQF